MSETKRAQNRFHADFGKQAGTCIRKKRNTSGLTGSILKLL
jgi:hypothetical protein